MSVDIPLKEYMDTRFDHLEALVVSKFDQARESAEFGDRQNAQALSALGSNVTQNTHSINRLENNQIQQGTQIRHLQDDNLVFSTQKKTLIGLVTVAGVGNIAALARLLIGG